MPRQGILQAHLGHVHRIRNIMWLRILSLRLACARKGHLVDHRSVQLDCPTGPSFLERFQAASRRWSCLVISFTLYDGRVSCQDCLHHSLADHLPRCLRPPGPSVSWTFPVRKWTLLIMNRSSQPRVFLLDRFSLLYTTVAIPLIAYCSFFHYLIFGNRFEFLPLMFTSSYSALGVVGSWLGFLVVYFTA